MLLLGQRGRGGCGTLDVTMPGDDTGSSMNMATMPIDEPLHHVAEIAKQMPAICDLDGVWRSAPGPIRIGSSPVANDDFDTGVLLEPGGEGVGVPLGQKVENAPRSRSQTIVP